MPIEKSDRSYLEKRVEFLEEINRQFIYSIDVVKAFGELQRKIGSERDTTVILGESGKLISDLIHCEACAFLIVQPDMLEFAMEYVAPPEFKEDLSKEVDRQIEAGTFSWALKLLHGEIVKPVGLGEGKKLLMHPLATESRVLGMLVAVMNEQETKLSTEALVLLTIIMISTSLAMENALLYRELKQHNERLNDLVKERTAEIRKVMGMAAHDLRNPLSAIRGFAEILGDEMSGKLTEEQKELTGTIYTTAHSMLGMVNDMLDISVIESGELRLEIADVRLGDIISDVVKLCRITAGRKEIRIEVQQGPLPDPVRLDARKVRQVIDNLIGNGIKFSPKGSVILVKAGLTGGDIEIVVKDQGPGIPENERNKLFKSFSKTSVRPTGGETSTGLGLAICRRIVVAHGGEISIRCPSDGGSEFVVVLNVERLEKLT